VIATLVAGVLSAQDAAPTPEPGGASSATPAVSTETPAADPREAAIAFLRSIEEQNKNVTTLYGRFEQVRVNPMFLEEINSTGEFWYAKPDRFRCDYKQPAAVSFYMSGNEVVTYTPELAQVEKYRIPGGNDSAPINQMLVGFGVQTEKILEVFTVRLAPVQPSDEAQLAIEFASRDIDRSLGFSRITVTFDRESREPRQLFLEEEQDTVLVTLNLVRQNSEIPEGTFEHKFPPNVEIIEYR
jgi:outer membrane lipoprotein-sorting protein